MNYDFYADEHDKVEILDYIFNETDLKIFDLGSLPGERIVEYTGADEISEKFDLTNGGSYSVTFQLWSTRFKAQPTFRRIELNPKNYREFAFRYSTDGWGLIQLYFGGIKNNHLHHSHIGHFNEKGARDLESINTFNGKVDAWDWKEVEKTSRQLKYQIQKKMSSNRIGSTDIMFNAEKLRDTEIKFI